MELLLIRHALPIRREVTEGAADPPLSDIGRQQAQLLADYLASEQID
ncbi:MAG TPA: histidine phosphatase family protein, partial [Acidimicrobiaceae bacterium]|nr:histidine phosphatase family protein [Acidimicrobiaceae bacterium]